MAACEGADWVSFVFAPASPRTVTPVQAAALSHDGPPGPGRVGLFVDPANAEVAAVLHVLPLAALQVYAAPARLRALRERFGLPVWHGIGVADASDLPGLAGDQPDCFVLDAAQPPGAALPGGNACRFDWTLLQGWRTAVPWLLAGGLTPENVQDAVWQSGAAAVDVSSGVEQRRGVKDPARVRAFIQAARAASRSQAGWSTAPPSIV